MLFIGKQIAEIYLKSTASLIVFCFYIVFNSKYTSYTGFKKLQTSKRQHKNGF